MHELNLLCLLDLNPLDSMFYLNNYTDMEISLHKLVFSDLLYSYLKTFKIHCTHNVEILQFKIKIF